ncbi:MAG: heme-binding protein [Methyloceanibacter sp.]|nr:heme-binding protein [Methyloceanibacter sp.]
MWSTIAYYLLLTIESMAGVFGIRLSEEAAYKTIDHVGSAVEIREYAPVMVAEVTLPKGNRQARNQAFRLLFDYISGANKRAAGSDKVAMTVPVAVDEPERIAMTVPVQTSPESGTMRFFLPAKYTRETPPPEPTNTRVKVVALPATTIATLRYSGSGRDAERKEQELLKALKGSTWRPAGRAYTLYYDPPFTISFLRRNEAAVAVERAAGAR